MIRAHADACEARLEADTFLVDTTFEGVVTDRPERYCTFFLALSKRVAGSYTGPQSSAWFTITVHSVGTTIEQAQLVQEHVIAQLLGFKPTVTGRDVHKLSHEVSRRPTQDGDFWFCVDEFDFLSKPRP